MDFTRINQPQTVLCALSAVVGGRTQGNHSQHPSRREDRSGGSHGKRQVHDDNESAAHVANTQRHHHHRRSGHLRPRSAVAARGVQRDSAGALPLQRHCARRNPSLIQNIDPLNAFTDSDIIAALQRCGLW